MDLTRHVDSLTQHLIAAAAVGGEASKELAARIAEPFAAVVRGALLDVITDAAAEISRDLAPGAVDVRLRGRDVSFVVTAPGGPAGPAATATPDLSDPVDGESGAAARINFRPPEWLKTQIETAARAEGLSVNTYLVRTLATNSPGASGHATNTRSRRSGYDDHFTGWVQ